MAAQLLLLVLSIEVGGWFLTIYIGVIVIWAIYWSYKNWWLLKSISNYILYSAIGKKFLDKQVAEAKKWKRKR